MMPMNFRFRFRQRHPRGIQRARLLVPTQVGLRREISHCPRPREQKGKQQDKAPVALGRETLGASTSRDPLSAAIVLTKTLDFLGGSIRATLNLRQGIGVGPGRVAGWGFVGWSFAGWGCRAHHRQLTLV